MAIRSYRHDVDGMRALAVAAVIANHFSERVLPSGFLGVDIFFVISGFVITRSLIGRESAGLWQFLSSFYGRRVRRLLPALVVCVTVTALVLGLVDPDPRPTLRSGAFALFGLSNWALLQAGADYFSPSASLNGLLHTWSLGVEEQFYLVFPLIAWFTLLRGGDAGRRSIFIGVVGLAAAVSLWAWNRTIQTDPMHAFFLTHLRFWELAAGCLIAVVAPAGDRLSLATTRVLHVAAIACIVVLLVMGEHYSRLTTPGIVVATAAAIWGGGRASLADRALTAPVVTWLGTISYSLYLWHWPVLVLGRWTTGVHWWSWPILLAAMVLIAQASYSYVEQPLRARRWTGRSWSDFVAGMAGASVAAALIVALAYPLYGRLYTGERARLEQRDAESLVDDHSVAGAVGTWRGTDCVLRSNADADKAIDAKRCTLGTAASAERRLLVVGNSHSAAYVAAFDDLVRSGSYAVTLTSSFGAAPFPELTMNPAYRSSSDHYWQNVVPNLEAGLRKGDTVLIISDVAWLSPKPWVTDDGSDEAARIRRSLEAKARALGERGIGLAVLDGIPFVRDAGCTPDATLRQWYNFGSQTCRYYSRETTLHRRSNVRNVLDSLAGEGMITLVDVFDVFCPGRVCTYRGSDGRFLYRDEHSHPSREVMASVGPLIRAELVRTPQG